MANHCTKYSKDSFDILFRINGIEDRRGKHMAYSLLNIY